MEYKKYLTLCHATALLKGNIHGIKELLPDWLKVYFDGLACYAAGLEIRFDYHTGKPIYTAILRTVKRASFCLAPLESVTGYEERTANEHRKNTGLNRERTKRGPKNGRTKKAL